jgi:ubiquinol-cytochrome c reductase cytochrome b subunit
VKKLLRAIGTWLEDRLGLGSLMGRMLAGTVERHGAWLRTTGMVCLVLVLVECITGPILGLYYTPSASAAYKDILTIEQNPMGRFLRGLHHWSSATLIMLALITVVRMFFGGEYKKRRDIVWIATLLFLQFVLLFQLTGHVLPWDTNAASTANVEAGIGANVWVVGPTIKQFLLGGPETGEATLTRWYGFHALLLPLAALIIVGLPLWAYRVRSGEAAADPESETTDSPRPREPYYPNHMAREMAVALVVFLVVAGLAFFTRTPLEKEATAANLNGYQAKSEWYVLPLHAATLIPPFNTAAFEPVATFVLPGALFTLLIALPFIDRNPSRRLNKRPFAVTAGSLVILSTVGLYLFAVVTEREKTAPQEKVAVGRPGGAEMVVDTQLAADGKALYAKQGCDSCHAIAGKGAKVGPELTQAGMRHPDRDWQIAHLIKPDSKVPGSAMPAYAQLKPSELKALAEYIISLR